MENLVRGGYGLFFNNVADGSWSFPARAIPDLGQPLFQRAQSGSPVQLCRWETRPVTWWPIPPGITFQTNAREDSLGYRSRRRV